MGQSIALRLGLTVGFVLIAGLAAGLVADDLFGTRPLATLLGSVTAAHLAMLVVYRTVSASLREIGEARERATEGSERLV